MSYSSNAFEGFSRQTFSFLRDLASNNDKQWFEAHRDVYREAVKEPALSFVESMGSALQELVPTVLPEPRVGGSLFRIHRDIRFSANKSPYKTHVGIRFRDREALQLPGCNGPLFYVEIAAQALRIGVGVKLFDPESLLAYRRLVTGMEGSPADVAVLNEMEKLAAEKGHDVLGAALARTPRGFPRGRNAGLARRKGFFIRENLSLPGEILGPGFVAYCEQRFRPYVPLFECLRGVVLSAPGRAAGK